MQAFEAGADLILMPADADKAIDAVCAALDSGRIPSLRLEQSLQRRRDALQRCSGDQARTEGASAPDAGETTNEHQLALALVSTTLERQGATPVHPPAAGGVTLIRVDGVLGCPFLRPDAPAIVWPASRGFRPIICHDLGISPWHEPPQEDNPLALDRLDDGPVLLQLFLRGNPFRGARDRQEPWSAAVQQLQNNKRLSSANLLTCPLAGGDIIALVKHYPSPSRWHLSVHIEVAK